MEKNLLADKEWRFLKEDIKDAYKRDFKDDEWEKILLPHTWNSQDVQEGKGNVSGFLRHKKQGYYRGIGWYRIKFPISEEQKSKRIFIRFQAAGSVAEIYLNENLIGTHYGAFSAFCFELTEYINYDEGNILAVKVSNAWRDDLAPLSGDFPVMGGLYRPVELFLKEKSCFSPLDHATSGVYISQREVTEKRAELEFKIQISSTEDVTNVNLIIKILNQDGVINQERKKTYSLEKGDTSISQKVEILNPHLWNGKLDPYLYQVKTELIHDEGIMDEVSQSIGIRYFKIDPENGFFLNGKKYPIQGVNRHQDRLNKGWALSKADHDEDLKIILEMGVTAIRLAHYQHSEYFYSQCDKLGILVWAELAIVNRVGFSTSFFENSKSMLLELIKQNYNHASIFTWSLANELGFFQLRSPVKIIKKLNDIVHKEDGTRPSILAAIGLAFFRKKLHRITDLIGWNHYPGWYYFKAKHMGSHLKKFNKVGNFRGLCVSEYGAGASIHHHKPDLKQDDKIKASGKFHPEEKQNLVHEENYRQMERLPFVWGTFVWNMFDFAVSTRDEGDTPGRNDKGLVTYDRKVKKDAYFFYKANWSKDPVVYITSRRAIKRSNKITTVKVYSNCEKVELRINDKVLGKMSKEKFCIFRLANLELSEGQNNIYVRGLLGGKEFLDSCSWNLSETSSNDEI
jgi:beta-galactosidase